MQTLAAILAGKLISKLTRTLKIGGGSAAPGLYALKIDPNLVEKLAGKIPRNVVITGTNGKTTTARMITHLAKEAGLTVIRNSTGSNLERGIASTLIANYQLPTTNYQLDLGIWELDEAAFNAVAPKLKPDIIIFLNVSRDQLDRYGEIDKVVEAWCNTLSKLNPKTTILINLDDQNLASLKNHFKGKIIGFGKKNIKNIKTKGLDGSYFNLTINNLPAGKAGIRLSVNLPLPGLYHIYDAVAAIVCATHLNLPIRQLISSLKNFSPAFGRFEKLPLPRLGSDKAGFGYIFLIKNPVGASQVFETIAPQLKKNDRLLLALNDKLADGTDVSWIWDAEFEQLANRQLTIICSGTRAYDLAVRLKYAGFNPNTITVELNLKKALQQAREGLRGLPAGRQGKLFILPTYTAMLEIQKDLVKSEIKKHYWEEE